MNRRDFLKKFGLGVVGVTAAVAIPISIPKPVPVSMPALKEKSTPPTYSFIGDSDTGIYVAEENRICVTGFIV